MNSVIYYFANNIYLFFTLPTFPYQSKVTSFLDNIYTIPQVSNNGIRVSCETWLTHNVPVMLFSRFYTVLFRRSKWWWGIRFVSFLSLRVLCAKKLLDRGSTTLWSNFFFSSSRICIGIYAKKPTCKQLPCVLAEAAICSRLRVFDTYRAIFLDEHTGIYVADDILCCGLAEKNMGFSFFVQYEN